MTIQTARLIETVNLGAELDGLQMFSTQDCCCSIKSRYTICLITEEYYC